jgi:hypothetical protein
LEGKPLRDPNKLMAKTRILAKSISPQQLIYIGLASLKHGQTSIVNECIHQIPRLNKSS